MPENESESTQNQPNSFAGRLRELTDRFRENATWNILWQITLWVVGVGSTIFIPPPVGPTQQPNAIESVARYLIAILAGVIIAFALLWNKRRHLRAWLIPVPIALLLTVSGYFVYSSYIEKWTCPYTRGPSPRLVVIGETETPKAQRSRQDPRCNDAPSCKTCCNNILYCHGSNEYVVWNGDEINYRRRILTGAYFSMLPFVLVGIMCVIQAIYCAQQQEDKDNKQYFGGIWEGEMERGKTELLLNLQFTRNSVTGTIIFYSINQEGAISPSRPKAIEEAEFKEDSLLFLVRGRQEKITEYQMTLTTNVDEAALDTIGESEKLHWNLYRDTQRRA